MADHLHPAIDIPGEGLWEGACIAHSDGDGVTVEDQRGCHAVLCVLYDDDGEARLAHPSVARLSLRLDDPLGLGLAGLAGRVAERVGIADTQEGPWGVAVRLLNCYWLPPRTRDLMADGDDEIETVGRVIREAATLLARLDRLAAAVWPEYRVEAGRVPTWTTNGARWTLDAGALGSRSWTLDTPDPIEAAGAALEVCGG